jgi:hypothetical protein
MSEDEVLVAILGGFVAAVAWARWLWAGVVVAPRCSPVRDRWPLLAAPLAAGLLLYGVLRAFASLDVRDSPTYLGFYGLLGAAWVGAATLLLPLFGLSPRDDVAERRNPAAARALAGALLGITLCFAGGNIGNGPGWWVVFFSAALATAAFFLLWLLLDMAAGLADTVTVDRDPAAGLRLAAFFVAAGAILGRAVAGDWVSARATLDDFAVLAWPALGLLVAAALVERRLRPSPERPLGEPVAQGLAPAALYLAIAAVALAWAGGWS